MRGTKKVVVGLTSEGGCQGKHTRLYNDNTAVHSKYYTVTNTSTGHTAELHIILTSGVDTELTDSVKIVLIHPLC